MNVIEDASDPRIPSITEKQWFELFKYYSQTTAFTHIERNGYNIIDSIHPMPTWNGVFLATITEDQSSQTIDECIKYFKPLEKSWTWKTGSATKPENLPEILENHGFTNHGDTPCMAVNLKDLIRSKPVEGLEIVEVKNDDTLRDWSVVIASIFAEPGFSDSQMAVESELGFHPNVHRRYVGYLDSKPVSTSAMLLCHGVAGLYMIGTLPEYRRRGIGTALTVYPLYEAEKLGYKVGILHSSQQGYPVYSKIGFIDVALLKNYRISDH